MSRVNSWEPSIVGILEHAESGLCKDLKACLIWKDNIRGGDRCAYPVGTDNKCAREGSRSLRGETNVGDDLIARDRPGLS